VLDGEVGNSTHTEDFAKAHPGRYFEMFIAEQQLVVAAVGLQVRGYVPFAATFAAFFTRAYDFILARAVSGAAGAALVRKSAAARSAAKLSWPPRK
jgi:transketolase